MDASGVIVTRVDSTGMARVALLGNRGAAEWVGATVAFEGGGRAILGYDRGGAAKDGSEIDPDALFLETGLAPAETKRRLSVGAVAALEDRPSRLGDLWCAANLDNRAGCAAVIAALRSARASRYDLHVVFTAQSDLGGRGAAIGAFGIDPELAVVVDVSHLDSKSTNGVELGKGPCLGLKEDGYVAHPQPLALARKAAAGAKVKTQWLIREAEASDARAVRGARIGVPTVLVAIPARRSGGTASLVHARDLSQTAKLLARLLQTRAEKTKGGRR
jgi:endoglucanase